MWDLNNESPFLRVLFILYLLLLASILCLFTATQEVSSFMDLKTYFFRFYMHKMSFKEVLTRC